MNNNDNFNNNQNGGWGSTPDNSSFDPNQNSMNNFNQTQDYNNWGSNQDYSSTDNWGVNQNSEPADKPYDSAFTPNSSENLSDGFNPNNDYSNGDTGFNPNQTYSNNFYNAPNTNGYNNNFGYQPVDNQYNYDNPQMNTTQDMYGNNNMSLGQDINKGKAIASLTLGIISCVLSFIGIACFWGAIGMACETSSTTTDSTYFAIGTGVLLSVIIPFVALVLGIIGIISGAGYYKNSKKAGVYTNKGKATGGIIFNVIAVLLSAVSAISCATCVSCSACISGDFENSYSSDYYDNYDYDDFDDYDYDYDYDLDDFL